MSLAKRLINYVTPRSRIFLETLIVAQLLKKFPSFYATRRVITVFTSARYWSLSWASWIQFASSYPLSLRSILISSSHLCSGPTRFVECSVCISQLLRVWEIMKFRLNSLYIFYSPLLVGSGHCIWMNDFKSMIIYRTNKPRIIIKLQALGELNKFTDNLPYRTKKSNLNYM
jgi:hypothetical protein